ncbi:sigma-54-dependent Fis family transcriptional regulator [Biomaibacter acetigenes]|nr:sigma 54-interacting transcriptional regulator [Biomaibacter acetigenes]
MTYLMDIQADAQRVANAINAALGLEVTISDSDYNLVASSRGYFSSKGSVLNSSFKAELFRSQKPIIVENPGYHPYCADCSWAKKCPEKALILTPIIFRGQVIGDIGLTSFSEEQKNKILNYHNEYIEFLNQMGEFLTVKIAERAVHNELLIFSEKLVNAINFTEEGLIYTDSIGTITLCNTAAAQLFNMSSNEMRGLNVINVLPSLPLKKIESLDNETWESELIFTRQNRKYHLLVSARSIKVKQKVEALIISARDMQEVRQFVYRIGGTGKLYSFEDIIGNCQSMRAVKDLAKEIANSVSTVLLLGETGTGKELFARAIHCSSSRHNKPFIAINCGAIPDTLLESELFGYEDGTFTGGRHGGKPGKFEMANGGTIFLDEIGDLPLYLQVKLLRVIQEKEIERLGSSKTLPINVRIIAATHKNLEKMVRQGEFREDLYYRLNVIPIYIPPLRERADDIPLLIEHMIKKYSNLLSKNITGISDKAMKALMNYEWPGNIRELENCIEYAINIEKDTVINLSSLPSKLLQKTISTNCEKNDAKPFREKIDNVEKSEIITLLEKYKDMANVKEKVAQELGISRATLYRRLRKYNIVIK